MKEKLKEFGFKINDFNVDDIGAGIKADLFYKGHSYNLSFFHLKFQPISLLASSPSASKSVFSAITPYKILSLSVGYDVNKDGELNSQQLIFEGITSRGADGNYKAVLFSPTNPIDQLASMCFVQLKNDTSLYMDKLYSSGRFIKGHEESISGAARSVRDLYNLFNLLEVIFPVLSFLPYVWKVTFHRRDTL